MRLVRNPIIATVFYRLGFIGRFGTGILPVTGAYAVSITKPTFDISENYLKVQLPVIVLELPSLSHDEQRAVEIFREKGELSRLELEESAACNKSKAIRVLNSLIDKHILVRLGSGPSSTYRLR